VVSAGERPGNLKRFGVEDFLAEPAKAIPSSSGTVTKGNCFKTFDAPSGADEAEEWKYR
jgi:hypothetical protein